MPGSAPRRPCREPLLSASSTVGPGVAIAASATMENSRAVVNVMVSDLLDQHLAPAVPVVLALAGLGQPFGVDLLEAALDEPVHRARGEHEDAVQAHGLGTLLHA